MSEGDQTGANPGFALGQLARALRTAVAHGDAQTRARGEERAERWARIYEGLISGALRVGSRTPLEATPAWATLEVAHGGFATGALLAAGPLRPHEEALLDRLGLPRDEGARAALNAWHLTDEGVAELRERLARGTFRVEVPEEGALLVVAWLLDGGRGDEARAILDEIGPFLRRLRFYPVPDPRPLTATERVHLETVGEVRERLGEVRERRADLARSEAVEVWAPLVDRMAALFAETVVGPLPRIDLDESGAARREGGRPTVVGGWPCQRYPDGWVERARACLRDFDDARKHHVLCGKARRPDETIPRLAGALAVAAGPRGPSALTGLQVGQVRLALAGIHHRRGLPGSERCRALRAAQAREQVLPSRHDQAQLLAARLATMPPDAGLDAVEPLAAAVDDAEAARLGRPGWLGRPVRAGLVKRVRRCLDAPIAELVDLKLIRSGEQLAAVAPQLTARIASAGIADPQLRRLHGAIYEAFRRRRSLLLLELSHQVRLGELPWLSPLANERRDSNDSRAAARAALTNLAGLALTSFPQTLLPNPLLTELGALAEVAGLSLPLVDELAADIFQGQFTSKFLDAARRAAEVLEGTLYHAYYDLPISRLRAMPLPAREPRRTASRAAPQGKPPVSVEFAGLCCERAGRAPAYGRPATNGMIIEQQQILTTQNLAVLVAALDLRPLLAPRSVELARRCLDSALNDLATAPPDRRGRLRAVKQCAYAFRHLVFFLALGEPAATEQFLSLAWARLAEQPAPLRDRFRPALEGLTRAAGGDSPEAPPGSRRLLGWSDEAHWLLA